MARISDVASTYSSYPTSVDTLEDVVEGTSSDSVTQAAVWNRLKSALYLLQTSTRAGARIVGPNSRRKVTLSGSVTTAAASGFVNYDFTLSTSQLAFLGGQLSTPGLFLSASVQRYSGASGEAYVTDTQLLPPNQIRVRFQRVDYDATDPQSVTYEMTAGTFTVVLTVWT